MNTPSPLIPQGALPQKGKPTVFFKVLMILAVHVVLIGGMLLQGCKDTKSDVVQPTSDTSSTTTTSPSSDTVPPATTPGGVSNATAAGATTVPAGSNVAVAPAPVTAPQPPVGVTSAPPVPAPIVPVAPTAPATGETREYVIASGDTLGALAHKNGISLKTLMEANPGVNPKKLKVGQKIQIPGGTGAVASTAAGTPATDMSGAATDSVTYTVKAGDTLGKIARANHTSYKKIMALNDLKTTSIKVGQKLKLPVTAAATPAPAPAVQPVVPVQPAQTTASAVPPSTTASN